MGRYKRILVAFDGSPSGVNALRGAFRLGAEHGSVLRVATAVPAFEGDLDLTGVGDVQEALLRPGRAALAQAAALAAAEGVGITTALLQGEPWRAITEAAECRGSAVIVMGRRGMSRITRALVGSVTARVIGHAACDVLVFPSGSTLSWGTLLAATDGSAGGAAAVEGAAELARAHGGSLAVLSVLDVPAEAYGDAPGAIDALLARARDAAEAAAARARAAGVEAKALVREGETAAEILAVAEEEGAGLVVVGSHGRTGLSRLLMGSVTEKVLGHARRPVLVVRQAPAPSGRP